MSFKTSLYNLRSYRYVGRSRKLRGKTALGKFTTDGKFFVQVDDMNHPWAFGWHSTNPSSWELTETSDPYHII